MFELLLTSNNCRQALLVTFKLKIIEIRSVINIDLCNICLLLGYSCSVSVILV